MLTTAPNLTKEAIASRMFRNAARFWGLNDTNMDNFDPLVRLLVEACAVEIYRIDNEIAALQRSMTERLAGLLIPEAEAAPRPAHAILHATAADEAMYTALDAQFVHQKRIASVASGPLDSSMEVLFAPAGRFKTINGDIRLLAMGSNIYRLNGLQQKEILFKTSGNRHLPAQTLWIGLEAAPGADLTDLPIFFQLKNTPHAARYLAMLHHARCTVQGRPVQLFRGLSDTSFEEHNMPFENALEELYINRRLEKRLSRIYADHFLTIAAKGNGTLKNIAPGSFTALPQELQGYLGATEAALLTQPLFWLKMELPAGFSVRVLDDLTVAINCFPVMNRRLNETSYRLNSYFNIIPLLSTDQFSAVKSVEGTVMNETGRADYVYYPFDQYTEGKKGTYAVRTGDLERFDSRNAAEYLNYLVELLRDESRSFAAFGQEFMPMAIKDLNQNIGLIEQKINQNLHLLQSSPTYLLINPLAEGDTIFVQFWTNNGEAGNGIRSGSPVELYEGSSFRKESLVLMTSSEGGRDRLANTETLKAFKSVLLSRGRVVTAVDVKNFCAAHLQEAAADISVERGVGISPMPGQGLMPVVNVRIKPAAGIAEQLDWERMKTELLAELRHHSAADVSYVIIIL